MYILRVYTSALACVYLCAAAVERGSKPERLCAFCVCACVACVYLCAAKVVESEGGSKPERLCAFCVCAFCVCIPLRLRVYTSALRQLWNQKAGVNRNACVHFACVRFACVYLCAAKVVESAGGSKPERLCAFCVCIPLRCESCGNQAGGSKPERLCILRVCVLRVYTSALRKLWKSSRRE